MSTLYVDIINEKTSCNGVEIPGHVIQVKSFTFTGTTTTTSLYSTAYVDTGLTINITPTSTSSKILIQSSIFCHQDSTFTYLKLMRDSTELALGDASSNRHRTTLLAYTDNAGTNNTGDIIGHNFLDSPSTTSQITYKWQFSNSSSSYTSAINRTIRDNDAAYEPRGSSTITVMEIGG